MSSFNHISWKIQNHLDNEELLDAMLTQISCLKEKIEPLFYILIPKQPDVDYIFQITQIWKLSLTLKVFPSEFP